MLKSEWDTLKKDDVISRNGREYMVIDLVDSVIRAVPVVYLEETEISHEVPIQGEPLKYIDALEKTKLGKK